MTFKEQCISLRKQDYTLLEIARVTGRPKTSVHFHIQHLPLSLRKRQEILDASAARIKRVGMMRRQASARLLKRFTEWDTELVRLVSHFLFDGEIKYGGCHYNNRNKALLRRVEQCMTKIYPREPKRYLNKFTGVWRISYFNVSLSDYIKEKSKQLLKYIRYYPTEQKREFIRTFFDDEGCIDYRPEENNRRIRGYQKNVEVLKIIKALLQDFDIKSRIQLPNEIVIVKQDNFTKFQKEIGFSPGVRINGKRSNSIWKKSLEKRVLLQRAIASYKPIGSNGVHRTRMIA